MRVQVSQVRKRLEQYFNGEGRSEPIVIEIPKGSYLPVYRERTPEPAPPEVVPERSGNVAAVSLGLLALALAIACAWLWWQNHALSARAQFGFGSQPTVDRLWRQMFGNGVPTHMVLADGSLLLFEDEIHQNVTVQEYERKVFDLLAAQRIPDPELRRLVTTVIRWPFTAVGDAHIAARLGVLSAYSGVNMEVVLARSVTTQQVASHNTILLGPKRGNPWVGLFEDSLNFQTVFEESPRVAYFLNRKPQPGEDARYQAQWSELGYCRVAFLPNPSRSGSSLLISGTNMASSEAGAQYISSERELQKLLTGLGARSGEAFPHFEVLLRTPIVNNAPSGYTVIAWRRH